MWYAADGACAITRPVFFSPISAPVLCARLFRAIEIALSDEPAQFKIVPRNRQMNYAKRSAHKRPRLVKYLTMSREVEGINNVSDGSIDHDGIITVHNSIARGAHNTAWDLLVVASRFKGITPLRNKLSNRRWQSRMLHFVAFASVCICICAGMDAKRAWNYEKSALSDRRRQEGTLNIALCDFSSAPVSHKFSSALG